MDAIGTGKLKIMSSLSEHSILLDFTAQRRLSDSEGER